MQIQPFDPIMDIPYYYPCNFPLILEVLKRQGSESSLSLLANSRLYGLPACSSSGLMKVYFNKLDYDDVIWRIKGKTEMPSFDEGMVQINERISGGELFLTTGTSYYLPYCEDYLNPKYIEKMVDPSSRLYLVDHWLSVYGVMKDHLLVYDPVPSRYSGPLSKMAFHDYWKGNISIAELSNAKRKEDVHMYCSVDIEADVKLTPSLFDDALLQALMTHTHEFLSGREIQLDGRTYYFGHAVSLKLLRSLHLGLTEEDDAFRTLSGFLFDMRWSRYFFRDLLRDIADRLGSSHISFANEFEIIIEQWEKAHKMLHYIGSRDHVIERISLIIDYVQKLVQHEFRFYEKLHANHRSMGIPLFRKIPNMDNKETLLQKDDLLRIVLDSCREINQRLQGTIPIELGLRAPLFGRNGNLDSLGLVSLLATVEQCIEEEYGIGINLSEANSQTLLDSPFRTVDSFIDYLTKHMPEAV